MAKSTKRSFLSFLILLMLSVLISMLIGCGNKEGTGTDPDTATGRQIASFTGSPAVLGAGQSSILSVRVTDSTGIPVSNTTVSFGFVTNNSGAALVTLNGGVTDAGGKATAIYTAGANTPTANLEDTVRATSGEATEALIIRRTAASQDGIRMTISATPTSLRANQSSIITATVTDAAGNPLEGETVIFAGLTDQSGLTLTPLGSTDASGRAIAVYEAGNDNPTVDVQDTIQASVSSGGFDANGAVIINRLGTASSSVVTPGYKLTLNASASSVAAGGHSIITATVTDGSGTPASGLPVAFALSTDNSGATLTNINTTTDAAGRAVVDYTAGSNSPTLTVQDVVNATVSSGGYDSADAIIITRTAQAFVATGYTVTLEATPVSLVAGEMSVLIAKVVDADGVAVSGQPVVFALAVNNSGATLTDVNTTTDADGIAIAVYEAGNNDPALTRQDVVSATLGTGEAAAAIITRLPAAGTGNRILEFTEDPDTTSSAPLAPPNEFVIMKVKVTTDDEVTPVEGIEVTFSILAGDGTISDTTATTDTNGEAFIYFTRPATGSGDTVIRAQIPGTTYGGDAARIVYWTDVAP